MRYTIFGGGGFIGSTIADRLLRDGHELRVFERPRVEPYRKFAAGESVEWLGGDLQSVHDVGAAIEGADAVVHLVSTTLPKSSNDDPVYDVHTNLVASLQLLDQMVARKVPRIVFISSGGTVYGVPQRLPVDESHPTEPQVSYGIVKLAIEKYLLMYQRLHGLKATILRVANPYGERQRVETAQGAVGVFLHNALLGKPIEIWGDGSVTRDYIHVSDVAEAFARALEYTGPHSVFIVSSGAGVSLNELIGMLEALLGRAVERRHLPGRAIDVPVNVLSNALAERELGWSPRVPLPEGLARTADWMRQALAAS
jgi:UDP-glucose 4-epimerase